MTDIMAKDEILEAPAKNHHCDDSVKGIITPRNKIGIPAHTGIKTIEKLCAVKEMYIKKEFLLRKHSL